MRAIETVTILDKSTGELFLIRCGSCGNPIYHIIFFGCSVDYCPICHRAKGKILHNN